MKTKKNLTVFVVLFIPLVFVAFDLFSFIASTRLTVHRITVTRSANYSFELGQLQNGENTTIRNITRTSSSSDDAYFKSRTIYEVHINDTRSLFIFSAIAHPSDNWATYSRILVTTWDTTTYDDVIHCCFLYRNLIVTQVPALWIGGKHVIAARQYQCLLPTAGEIPWKVTLSGILTKNCVKVENFTEIFYPIKSKGKFAVCTKVAYGNLHPMRLIEWFEYQRIMGVDHIITFLNNVDENVQKVFKFYEKIGLLETLPFDLPPMDKRSIGRGFEENRRKFPYFDHDERVATFDCEARMRGYEFAAVIDFDEFIVIRRNISFKAFFADISRVYPTIAAMTFHVEFFITNWNKVGKMSDIITLGHVKRTEPLWECMKNVYRPERVEFSRVTTHGVIPKRSFKLVKVPPGEATIHHYRKCPNKWKNCFGIPRFTDMEMKRFGSILRSNIDRLKRENIELALT